MSDNPVRSDESSTAKPATLSDVRFCHLVLGVTDMARALVFYRDLLGMDIVFDQLISGEPFDGVLHAKQQQQGRVVGGLVGGLMVELLSLGCAPSPSTSTKPGIVGIQNLSLSVTDLDATYQSVVAAGYQPDQKPFAIDRVRMFFVKDPDGTPVEFIELPHRARSSYEMHRGVPIVLGPQQ